MRSFKKTKIKTIMNSSNSNFLPPPEKRKFSCIADISTNDTFVKNFSKHSQFINSIFNSTEEQFKNIIEKWENSIQNKEYCPDYLLKILNHYSKIRPKKYNFISILVFKLFHYFPDLRDRVKDGSILQEIVWNREYKIWSVSPMQRFCMTIYEPNKFTYYIKEDDIETIQKVVLKKENFNFNMYIDLIMYSPLSPYIFPKFNIILTPNLARPTLIDAAAFYGSIKVFKYLLLNDATITNYTPKCSIAGANTEIIHILEQKNISFDNCFKTSVIYNHIDVSDWLLLHYSCEVIDIEKCITYLNYDVFFFLFVIQYENQVYSFSDSLYKKIMIQPISIVEFLIQKSEYSMKKLIGKACTLGNLDALKLLLKPLPTKEQALFFKQNHLYNKFLLHRAVFNDHLDVVKYLVEKIGMNIYQKDKDGKTPFDIAHSLPNKSISDYFFNFTTKTFKSDIKKQKINKKSKQIDTFTYQNPIMIPKHQKN